jgi:hypothetical protein
MVAFSKRYGFDFVAHERGDAKRSGRVERPFHFIEHNFYPGRSFQDLRDLNAQLRAWCDKVNGSFKPKLRAVPSALWALERTTLRPLPRHLPEVEELHDRVVDSEGFVTLHTNRYSVSLKDVSIGHDVLVHEGAERVRVFLGQKLLGDHARLEDGAGQRCTLPGHQDARGNRHREHRAPRSEQERLLRGSSELLGRWLDAARARGLTERGTRVLHRLWCDYPRELLERALTRAQEHGLYDLARIETMVLGELGESYFRLELQGSDKREGGEDGEG